MNLSNVDSILETPIPIKSDTSALNPLPFVSVLSKLVRSPILYPSPPFKIVIASTFPLVTVSTVDNCLTDSFDSRIESQSANSSPALYGVVFRIKFELLKSKSWFKI